MPALDLNLLSEQLLNSPMIGKQFSNEITVTPPEECDKTFTGDTGVEQESAPKPPGSSSLRLISVGVDVVSNQSFCFFLDKSSLGEFSPTKAPTFNETSFGDESQLRPNANRWLMEPDFHAEFGDRGACDSTSNQPPLSTGSQATKFVESDNSEISQACLELNGKGVSKVCVNSDAAKIYSTIEIGDNHTEQTTQPQPNSPCTPAKHSFKDLNFNDSLWMGKVSKDLAEMTQSIDSVLAMCVEAIKKGTIIKTQLTELQRYIRDCGGKEKEVMDYL